MNDSYARDLDLNLLRVFAVVAESGSVTQAAARLYLTQPAVSAALRRLSTAVGAPLFAKHGRGITLTGRGERLFATVRAHLPALVDAAVAPASFDPETSERTVRIGVADGTDAWLLPPLLRALVAEAPRMRLVVLPVQFRTVGEVLASRAVDFAVTVADELPETILRTTLFESGFVCVFDPVHARVGKALDETAYFAHEHVIVSYNGDLRGIVEDTLQRRRRVRCSLSSFAQVGAVVSGSALVATVPKVVAREIVALRPHLRVAELPFALRGAPLEMLWPVAADDDDASRFVREHVARIAQRTAKALAPRRRAKKG